MSEREMSEGEKLADALLPLLREYTERLREECEEYMKRSPTRLFAFGLGIASIGLGAICAAKLGWKDIPKDLSDSMHALLCMVSGSGLSFAILLWRRFAQRDAFKHHEIRTTAARLKKLVSLGSQVEDHALEEWGIRVQLQLRLADGEASLAFAEAVLANTWSIQSIETAGIKMSVGPAEEDSRTKSATSKSGEQLRERHS